MVETMRNERPKSRPYLRSTAVILAVGVFAAASPAGAAEVGVFTEPDRAPAFATNGIGLLVPGRGPTVSRDEALQALEGVPRGRCPCRYVVLLRLPDREHENDRRYAITIAGPGYNGLLVSDRTRIPGLVSIYDIKPTVEALRAGKQPPVRSRNVETPRGQLSELDQRLDEVGDTRTGASIALAAVVAAFALASLLMRSSLFGRAALLAVPATLTTGLVLSALEISKPGTVIAALAVAGMVGGLGLAAVTRERYLFAAALLAIFAVYLAVLSLSQETSSLAAIGPRPENGGRFYGFNNQLETLLLAPALLAAVLLGPRAVLPVGALAVVCVGASFAGADGGGVLVYTAGFVFLWMVLRRIPLAARNVVIAIAAVIAVGLALVGIDAAFGGESHITRSLEGGPDQVLGDIGDRIGSSVEGVVSSWQSAAVVLPGLAVLVWLALRRPRYAVLDALFVALAVSLIVNDAPREVAGFGALSAAALRFWREADEGVPRRALGAPP